MNCNFDDEEALDLALSEPTPAVIDWARTLDDDLLILGIGGKMGPTLARMARRACEAAGVRRRVIGVSRFSRAGERERLASWGIETIAGDLLDPAFVATLPAAKQVVFMAGMKFGATGNEALTWAMNTVLPANVCQRFAGARIAAFSTGNVYGLTPLQRGGSRETDAPNPQGEYAMSCLGRERVFEHFSRAAQTPVSLLRLNYACELRYGVLTDLALSVWRGTPIDLSMGVVNVIWQADANAMALLSLREAACPACVLNLAGPEQLSVRRIAEQFGVLFGKSPVFTGTETDTALLSNGQAAHRRFGYPRVGPAQLIEWIADWVRRGKPLLGKPTHFEVRNGAF